jgi:hypothetical protein
MICRTHFRDETHPHVIIGFAEGADVPNAAGMKVEGYWVKVHDNTFLNSQTANFQSMSRTFLDGSFR